jgi:hypothetical protein
LVVRDLAPDVPENSNGGYQFLDDVATGHLSARLCVQGYCGGHADPSPDAREETYESVDGGVTWGPILSPPRGTYIEGARADGNLVAFSTNGSGAISEWFTWPDMEPVSPPGPNLRALMIGGRLLWRSISTDFPMDGGTFYDEQGELVAAPIERPIPGTYDFQRRAVLNLVTWNPSPRDGGVTGYLSEVAPDGAILRSVRYQGYDVSPIAWRDDDRVVVLRYYPRDESIGAAYIVNLETGEMNEIDGLRPTDQDRDSYVTALMTGEFAMVVAPGSCLHVRAAASADSASRECFADGVLFEVTGAGMDDANRAEWLPVRAPGGIEGFASTEFLTR